MKNYAFRLYLLTPPKTYFGVLQPKIGLQPILNMFAFLSPILEFLMNFSQFSGNFSKIFVNFIKIFRKFWLFSKITNKYFQFLKKYFSRIQEIYYIYYFLVEILKNEEYFTIFYYLRKFFAGKFKLFVNFNNFLTFFLLCRPFFATYICVLVTYFGVFFNLLRYLF